MRPRRRGSEHEVRSAALLVQIIAADVFEFLAATRRA